MDKILNVLLFFTILVVVILVLWGLLKIPDYPKSPLCVEECYRGNLYLVCPNTGVVQMFEENIDEIFPVKCDATSN